VGLARLPKPDGLTRKGFLLNFSSFFGKPSLHHFISDERTKGNEVPWVFYKNVRIVCIIIGTMVCSLCRAGSIQGTWLDCDSSMWINCFVSGCANQTVHLRIRVFLWDPSSEKLWEYDLDRRSLKDMTSLAGYKVSADRIVIQDHKDSDLSVTEHIDRFSLKFYSHGQTRQEEQTVNGLCKKGKPRKVATEPTI
jgi:hypothetical protein